MFRGNGPNLSIVSAKASAFRLVTGPQYVGALLQARLCTSCIPPHSLYMKFFVLAATRSSSECAGAYGGGATGRCANETHAVQSDACSRPHDKKGKRWAPEVNGMEDATCVSVALPPSLLIFADGIFLPVSPLSRLPAWQHHPVPPVLVYAVCATPQK